MLTCSGGIEEEPAKEKTEELRWEENQERVGLRKQINKKGSSVKGKMITYIQHCADKCLKNGYWRGWRALICSIC